MKTLLLEIIVLFTLPISAMTVYDDIYALRHCYAFVIIIYFLLTKRHLKFPSITSNLILPPRDVVAIVTGFSILIATLLIIIHQYSPLSIDTMVMTLIHQPHLKLIGLIAYPLISVPIQEILFRWFFLYYTKSQINQLSKVIFLNAVVFSLAHLPFLSPLMLLGTFCLGLWWSRLTLKYHSLIPSLMSHSIIGTALLYLGL